MPFPTSRSISLIAKSTLLALATSVLFATGCGIGASAGAGNGLGEAPVTSSALSGVAHGGRQKILGANVYVMAAGKTGYGSPSEVLASTTTDLTTGSFSFPAGSYTCPLSTDANYSDTIYILLGGGNPGANSGTAPTNNTASVELAVLGDCATVVANHPFVGISEASTFGGMTAMQQFFNPATASPSFTGPTLTPGTQVTGESFGTSSTNVKGLANAALVVPYLVGTLTGLPQGTLNRPGFQSSSAYALSNYTIDGSNNISFKSGTTTNALVSGQTITVSGVPSPNDFLNGTYTVEPSPAPTTTTYTVTSPTFSHAAVGTSTTISGTVTPTTLVQLTPETDKLSAAANVLAACVNSTGPGSTPCAALFGDIVPSTSSVTVGDILQAAYFMATNPMDVTSAGSNIAAVCSLGSAFQPYTQSTVSCGAGSPYDWTIGVAYNSSSMNGTSALFDYALKPAIDAQGNVYILSSDSSSANSPQNTVTEIDPTGTAIKQVLNANLTTPNDLIIDPAGDLWVANLYSATGSVPGVAVTEYTTGGTVNVFTTNQDPSYLASDGLGNIFVAEKNTASGVGSGDLEEIPAGSATGTTATTLASGVLGKYLGLAIDSNYTVWVDAGGTPSGTIVDGSANILQFPCVTCIGPTPTYFNSPATSAAYNSYALPSPEVSIAVDNSNDIWVTNYQVSTANTALSIDEVAPSKTATIKDVTGSPYSPAIAVAKHYAEMEAIDGAGNMWLDMEDDTISSTSAGSVMEVSPTGALLSPTVGFYHGFGGTGIELIGIAIDGSGNIWTPNNNTTGASSINSSKPVITEIVGAAAPVVTPLAAGLPTTPGGTSNLGIRP